MSKNPNGTLTLTSTDPKPKWHHPQIYFKYITTRWKNILKYKLKRSQSRLAGNKRKRDKIGLIYGACRAKREKRKRAVVSIHLFSHVGIMGWKVYKKTLLKRIAWINWLYACFNLLGGQDEQYMGMTGIGFGWIILSTRQVSSLDIWFVIEAKSSKNSSNLHKDHNGPSLNWLLFQNTFRFFITMC